MQVMDMKSFRHKIECWCSCHPKAVDTICCLRKSFLEAAEYLNKDCKKKDEACGCARPKKRFRKKR